MKLCPSVCEREREYVRGCATRSDIFDTHWLKYRRGMQHEVVSLTSQRQHWQRVAGCSRGLLPVAGGCLSTCWKKRQSYSRGILHDFQKKGGSRETGTYSFRIDSRVFVARCQQIADSPQSPSRKTTVCTVIVYVPESRPNLQRIVSSTQHVDEKTELVNWSTVPLTAHWVVSRHTIRSFHANWHWTPWLAEHSSTGYMLSCQYISPLNALIRWVNGQYIRSILINTELGQSWHLNDSDRGNTGDAKGTLQKQTERERIQILIEFKNYFPKTRFI